MNLTVMFDVQQLSIVVKRIYSVFIIHGNYYPMCSDNILFLFQKHYVVSVLLDSFHYYITTTGYRKYVFDRLDINIIVKNIFTSKLGL